MGDRGGKKNRGKKPSAPGQAAFVPVTTPPASTGLERPKFSFQFIQPGFSVKELSQEQQAAVARTLQERSQLTWNELVLADRHGQGVENMPQAQIKPRVPVRFGDQEKFLVFRYAAKLPMVGARVGDLFHVLWIERTFGQVYDH